MAFVQMNKLKRWILKLIPIFVDKLLAENRDDNDVEQRTNSVLLLKELRMVQHKRLKAVSFF